MTRNDRYLEMVLSKVLGSFCRHLLFGFVLWFWISGLFFYDKNFIFFLTGEFDTIKVSEVRVGFHLQKTAQGFTLAMGFRW